MLFQPFYPVLTKDPNAFRLLVGETNAQLIQCTASSSLLYTKLL